jgi:hypothetical protein
VALVSKTISQPIGINVQCGIENAALLALPGLLPELAAHLKRSYSTHLIA